ncbi:hypothetical protein [Pontibacter mangrovi]|uniref:Lipoprotein n=1 Tax=Pontibacter mangrovi TaxID=2589816 RepID=A0A501W620_9BACT|nr:hypothetical protein [Pontibacter mangrovi]TPE44182.1 hypothetical protein FJM65_08420 [Pontibacter mangrovi]
MKLISQILTLTLFAVMCSCAPEAKLFRVDDTKVGVNYKSSRGTIFNQNYSFDNFFVIDVDSTTQWTPNKEDIELAEKILRAQIKDLNKNRVNQMGSCPVIHSNLYSYFRQYVGVKNDKGERVIHINFYWDKYGMFDRIRGSNDSRLSYDSHYTMVFDGCSYYWQVNVNLDQQELSNLMINGAA